MTLVNLSFFFSSHGVLSFHFSEAPFPMLPCLMRGCNSFQLVSFTSDAHSFAAKIFEVLLSSELLFYNFLPPLTYWKLDLVYGRVTIQEGDADL